jgi:hypothetical protein
MTVEKINSLYRIMWRGNEKKVSGRFYCFSQSTKISWYKISVGRYEGTERKRLDHAHESVLQRHDLMNPSDR